MFCSRSCLLLQEALVLCCGFIIAGLYFVGPSGVLGSLWFVKFCRDCRVCCGLSGLLRIYVICVSICCKLSRELARTGVRAKRIIKKMLSPVFCEASS